MMHMIVVRMLLPAGTMFTMTVIPLLIITMETSLTTMVPNVLEK